MEKDIHRLTAARRGRALKLMEEQEIEALLVTNHLNVRYLTGFTGSHGALMLSPAEAIFVTDGRYAEQVSREVPEVRLEVSREAPAKTLAELARRGGLGAVGGEAESLTWAEEQELAPLLGEGVLRSQRGLIESLRLIKDDWEIEALRRAEALADEVLAEVSREIRPGVVEHEVAARIVYEFMHRGARGVAFETIVASGERSSLPHGIATDRVIQAGDLVVVDLGCYLDGYASDLTRTLVVGEPDEEQRRVHRVVREALKAALEAARAGLSSAELDAVARRKVEEEGMGERFIHSLGHGVGLAVHEEPRLSEKSEVVLRAGMVVTVEPGVYVPGWGGVRLEDLVVIREDGAEVLSRSPYELVSVGS